MAAWIDFKQQRQQLDFAAVLRHYGVELKVRNGNQHSGFCPLPTHEGHRKSASLSANLTWKCWQCFSCQCSGNAIDFAIRMEGLDPDNPADVRTVALRLQDIFKLQPSNAPRRQTVATESAAPAPDSERASERLGATKKRRQLLSATGALADKVAVPEFSTANAALPANVLVNPALDFELRNLDAEHPYLRARGFTTETIARFGLGFCSKGMLAGRIAIPIHSTAGELIGYAGRLVDDTKMSESCPKYLFPGARERNGKRIEFRKSELLYNLHRVEDSVSCLLVVEGFASVWHLHQNGICNVVALMGSSCSESQAGLIVQRCTACVIVIPDGDAAGTRCAQSVWEHVGQHRPVRRAVLPAGLQPTDLCRVALHDLLGSYL